MLAVGLNKMIIYIKAYGLVQIYEIQIECVNILNKYKENIDDFFSRLNELTEQGKVKFINEYETTPDKTELENELLKKIEYEFIFK